METMINLNDLLKHEILDLYSAEEQIIEAMPAMIEKARNPELKNALREHLRITEEQKSRLDKVKETFGEGDGKDGEGENKGFFSRLFSGSSGGEKCRGMEGLITEGEKIMAADITDEALDAAIIASAQKIEHYEICGYGTARAFARELKMAEVERLLTQTLNEEYQADDRLTKLAVGKLNVEAEQADGMDNGNESSARSNTGSANGKSKSSSKSNGKASSKSSGKALAAATGKAGNKASSSKNGKSKSAGRGRSSKVTVRSSAGRGAKPTSSKTVSKGSASRSGSKSALKSKTAKKSKSRGR